MIRDKAEQAWNTGMKLKHAVTWLAEYGMDKKDVLQFWNKCNKAYGFNGSIPHKRKSSYSPKPSRRELINKYSVSTGMFGNYAQWLGLSVSHFLIQNGYEPLTERSKP